MSRYIDADALKPDYYEEYEAEDDEYVYRYYSEEQIDKAPSIDIVRCKECKSWKWIEWAKEYRCTLRNTAFNARADDFCSYAERRTDE